MDGSTVVFRSSLIVLWRWTTMYYGTLGVLILATSIFSGEPIPLSPTGGLTLLIGTLFAIGVVCFPVYVFTDGIRCYNFYGFYRTVAWDSITAIKWVNVVGLQYLAVSSTLAGSEIYIPLYLVNMEKFIELVQERAGDENPLARALQPYA